MEKKHNIVYKTTNVINGMWYIGRHSTDNINDGYLGSGKYLLRAIKVYGRTNFLREILFTFETKEASLLKERELVTQEVVKDSQNYNLILGGRGVTGYKWTEETRIKKSGKNHHYFGKFGKEHPCYGYMAHKLRTGKDSNRYGVAPANTGVCGIDNPRTMKYTISFEDGSHEVVYWLDDWCKKWGYRSITIRNLLFGRRGQYKDIIKVEYVIEEKTKHKRMAK